MKIKQFFDEGLAHNSYAIDSACTIALIDPGRNPQPYLDFAAEQKGKIVAVFETHPHADFISSHREFYEKHEATVFVHEKVEALYPHTAINHGDEVPIGEIVLRAIFTPGHSPDHMTYLLLDEEGQPHALFTGDSLLVGDVGRPDLREGGEGLKEQRETLARQMYHTIHQVFKPMADNLLVYPAHGAGSLCGSNLSSDPYSTLGAEKKQNWAFSTKDQKEFVDNLVERQPFIPEYFSYDLEVNRKGAPPYQESIRAVSRISSDQPLQEDVPIVDVRDESQFKEGHMPGSLNIQVAGSFETWLGSIITPHKPFYLVAANEGQLDLAIRKAAKIGYETFIRGALLIPHHALTSSARLDLNHFTNHPEAYTIIDVRNPTEYQSEKIFPQAKNLPLASLGARVDEIRTDQPIVVHCASGYRSAIGASILERELPQHLILDLSDAIKEFKSQPG